MYKIDDVYDNISQFNDIEIYKVLFFQAENFKNTTSQNINETRAMQHVIFICNKDESLLPSCATKNQEQTSTIQKITSKRN